MFFRTVRMSFNVSSSATAPRHHVHVGGKITNKVLNTALLLLLLVDFITTGGSFKFNKKNKKYSTKRLSLFLAELD